MQKGKIQQIASINCHLFISKLNNFPWHKNQARLRLQIVNDWCEIYGPAVELAVVASTEASALS